MGIEPKDSTAVSFMISSGWLTIADWRIALSNIGGLVGTAFYTIAALSFIEYLKYKLSQCKIYRTTDLKTGPLYFIIA